MKNFILVFAFLFLVKWVSAQNPNLDLKYAVKFNNMMTFADNRYSQFDTTIYELTMHGESTRPYFPLYLPGPGRFRVQILNI